MKALSPILGARAHRDRKQGLCTAIDFVVGSDSTRTCNQTAISGGIRIDFIDFRALSLENNSV
jgi:hypothetical protein